MFSTKWKSFNYSSGFSNRFVEVTWTITKETNMRMTLRCYHAKIDTQCEIPQRKRKERNVTKHRYWIIIWCEKIRAKFWIMIESGGCSLFRRFVSPNTQISYTWRFVHPKMKWGSFIRTFDAIVLGSLFRSSLFRRFVSPKIKYGSMIRRFVNPKME